MRKMNALSMTEDGNQVLISRGPHVDNLDEEEQVQRRVNLFGTYVQESTQPKPTLS